MPGPAASARGGRDLRLWLISRVEVVPIILFGAWLLLDAMEQVTGWSLWSAIKTPQGTALMALAALIIAVGAAIAATVAWRAAHRGSDTIQSALLPQMPRHS